MKNNG